MNPNAERAAELSAALVEALDSVSWEEIDEWRYAFDVARAAQGVLYRFGIDPHTFDLQEIRQLIDDTDNTDYADLFDQLLDVWHEVKVPEGVDPLAHAVRLSSNHSVDFRMVEGIPKHRRELAGRIYAIALELHVIAGVEFALPQEKLAELLGVGHPRISRVIGDLCRVGKLKGVRKHNHQAGRAKTYSLSATAQ